MRRALPLLLLLLVCAVPAHAKRRRRPKPAPDRVQAVLAEMDALARAEENGRTLEARAAERKLRGYGRELKLLGPQAVSALGAALRENGRPLKLRLYCAAILGLLGDPGGFVPLRDAALDTWTDPGLRSAGLQALAGLRVGEREKRRVLDQALADTNAPAQVWREALAQLADLGTDDPSGVARAAERDDFREQDGRNAVAAVAGSPVTGAGLRVFELLPRLAGLPAAEADALGFLAQQPRLAVGPRESDVVFEILRRGHGRSAALAARVASRLSALEAADELKRALRSRDPEVVAEAAEGLARLKDPKAASALQALAGQLESDRRFLARPGVDGPAYAARVFEASQMTLPSGVDRPWPKPKASAPPPQAASALPVPQAEQRKAAFRLDGFPGEKRPLVRWRGGTATLYERPDPDAPSKRVELDEGELEWDFSVVWTLEAGRATVRRPLELDVQDLGPFTGRLEAKAGAPRKVKLEPGTELQVLGVRAGGSCYVRRADELFDMECPQYYPGPYEVRGAPVTEWWVRVKAGGTAGWLTVAWKPGSAP